MNNLLVTGGAGFIGSNFVNFILEACPQYHVINLDSLTYAADINNIDLTPSQKKRYNFIEGNICDKGLVASIFNEFNITNVIHFAAESHVDNSIENPDAFIQTNITGTYVLLDAARTSWMEKPFKFKKGHEKNRFLHVSTDEVFGSLGEDGFFTEKTPYSPNSPYSASKASSDMIVRSYFETYGLNILITNCSNNYGPHQHDEKLIPTIIRSAMSEKPIPIYGDGSNIRDWLYVQDHCEAIHRVFEKGKYGETYLVGGNNEKSNLVVAQAICSNLDQLSPRKCGQSYSELITLVKDRPGHDWRYAINAEKIKKELDWCPNNEFNQGIQKTIVWYLDKYQKS